MFDKLVDPIRGGAALLVAGEVLRVSQMDPDKDTGEVKGLVQIGWFGGNTYFVSDLQGPLMRLGVGEQVKIRVPFTKGKTGWRAEGEPVILEAKATAAPKAGAA